MGKCYDAIDDRVRDFIEAQHVFFVATAPSGDAGHVNCSPKGLDALRVLGPRTVGWVDLVGSGVETIAHVRQNGRVVVMFCAFEGPPLIVRLHGRGEVIEADDPAFASWFSRFGRLTTLGVRAVVLVHVERIADSCGYGVPRYRYEGPRDQLTAWAERKGADGVEAYKRERNAASIDGIPALGAASAIDERARR